MKNVKFFSQPVLWIVLVAFFCNTVITEPVQAQTLNLPAPGQMVGLSASFEAPLMRGLKVFKDAPFKFEFIISEGDAAGKHSSNAQRKIFLKEESNKLIKYFLASLAIPEEDMWVNLSPYEKDRISVREFGMTEMGKDLLAQDYLLKQVASSVMYPEKEIGQKFWKTIYDEAYKRFGTTSIPVSTFNKVWIVPDSADVFENVEDSTAVITKSTLKVMLEEDYLALKKTSRSVQGKKDSDKARELSNQLVREIILPVLNREVNEGENFAVLRQVYHSLILAFWYKNKLRQTLLAKGYADRKRVSGVDVEDKNINQEIYQQYLKAYKKGVYNYIKEETTPDNQVIPRKYFSGGVFFGDNLKSKVQFQNGSDGAMLARSFLNNFKLVLVSGAVALTLGATGAVASDEGVSTAQPKATYATWAKNADVLSSKLSKLTDTFVGHQSGEELLDEKVVLVNGKPATKDQLSRILLSPTDTISFDLNKAKKLGQDEVKYKGTRAVVALAKKTSAVPDAIAEPSAPQGAKTVEVKTPTGTITLTSTGGNAPVIKGQEEKAPQVQKARPVTDVNVESDQPLLGQIGDVLEDIFDVKPGLKGITLEETGYLVGNGYVEVHVGGKYAETLKDIKSGDEVTVTVDNRTLTSVQVGNFPAEYKGARTLWWLVNNGRFDGLTKTFTVSATNATMQAGAGDGGGEGGNPPSAPINLVKPNIPLAAGTGVSSVPAVLPIAPATASTGALTTAAPTTADDEAPNPVEVRTKRLKEIEAQRAKITDDMADVQTSLDGIGTKKGADVEMKRLADVQEQLRKSSWQLQQLINEIYKEASKPPVGYKDKDSWLSVYGKIGTGQATDVLSGLGSVGPLNLGVSLGGKGAPWVNAALDVKALAAGSVNPLLAVRHLAGQAVIIAQQPVALGVQEYGGIIIPEQVQDKFYGVQLLGLKLLGVDKKSAGYDEPSGFRFRFFGRGQKDHLRLLGVNAGVLNVGVGTTTINGRTRPDWELSALGLKIEGTDWQWIRTNEVLDDNGRTVRGVKDSTYLDWKSVDVSSWLNDARQLVRARTPVVRNDLAREFRNGSQIFDWMVRNGLLEKADRNDALPVRFSNANRDKLYKAYPAEAPRLEGILLRAFHVQDKRAAVVIYGLRQQKAVNESVVNRDQRFQYWIERRGTTQIISRLDLSTGREDRLSQAEVYYSKADREKNGFETETYLTTYDGWMGHNGKMQLSGMADLDRMQTKMQAVSRYGYEEDPKTGRITVYDSPEAVPVTVMASVPLRNLDTNGYVVSGKGGFKTVKAPVNPRTGAIVHSGIETARTEFLFASKGSGDFKIDGKTIHVPDVIVRSFGSAGTVYMTKAQAFTVPSQVVKPGQTIEINFGPGVDPVVIKEGATVTYAEPYATRQVINGEEQIIPAIIERAYDAQYASSANFALLFDTTTGETRYVTKDPGAVEEVSYQAVFPSQETGVGNKTMMVAEVLQYLDIKTDRRGLKEIITDLKAFASRQDVDKIVDDKEIDRKKKAELAETLSTWLSVYGGSLGQTNQASAHIGVHLPRENTGDFLAEVFAQPVLVGSTLKTGFGIQIGPILSIGGKKNLTFLNENGRIKGQPLADSLLARTNRMFPGARGISAVDSTVTPEENLTVWVLKDNPAVVVVPLTQALTLRQQILDGYGAAEGKPIESLDELKTFIPVKWFKAEGDLIPILDEIKQKAGENALVRVVADASTGKQRLQILDPGRKTLDYWEAETRAELDALNRGGSVYLTGTYEGGQLKVSNERAYTPEEIVRAMQERRVQFIDMGGKEKTGVILDQPATPSRLPSRLGATSADQAMLGRLLVGITAGITLLSPVSVKAQNAPQAPQAAVIAQAKGNALDQYLAQNFLVVWKDGTSEHISAEELNNPVNKNALSGAREIVIINKTGETIARVQMNARSVQVKTATGWETRQYDINKPFDLNGSFLMTNRIEEAGKVKIKLLDGRETELDKKIVIYIDQDGKEWNRHEEFYYPNTARLAMKQSAIAQGGYYREYFDYQVQKGNKAQELAVANDKPARVRSFFINSSGIDEAIGESVTVDYNEENGTLTIQSTNLKFDQEVFYKGDKTRHSLNSTWQEVYSTRNFWGVGEPEVRYEGYINIEDGSFVIERARKHSNEYVEGADGTLLYRGYTNVYKDNKDTGVTYLESYAVKVVRNQADAIMEQNLFAEMTQFGLTLDINPGWKRVRLVTLLGGGASEEWRDGNDVVHAVIHGRMEGTEFIPDTITRKYYETGHHYAYRISSSEKTFAYGDKEPFSYSKTDHYNDQYVHVTLVNTKSHLTYKIVKDARGRTVREDLIVKGVPKKKTQMNYFGMPGAMDMQTTTLAKSLQGNHISESFLMTADNQEVPDYYEMALTNIYTPKKTIRLRVKDSYYDKDGALKGNRESREIHNGQGHIPEIHNGYLDAQGNFVITGKNYSFYNMLTNGRYRIAEKTVMTRMAPSGREVVDSYSNNTHVGDDAVHFKVKRGVASDVVNDGLNKTKDSYAYLQELLASKGDIDFKFISEPREDRRDGSGTTIRIITGSQDFNEQGFPVEETGALIAFFDFKDSEDYRLARLGQSYDYVPGQEDASFYANRQAVITSSNMRILNAVDPSGQQVAVVVYDTKDIRANKQSIKGRAFRLSDGTLFAEHHQGITGVSPNTVVFFNPNALADTSVRIDGSFDESLQDVNKRVASKEHFVALEQGNNGWYWEWSNKSKGGAREWLMDREEAGNSDLVAGRQITKEAFELAGVATDDPRVRIMPSEEAAKLAERNGTRLFRDQVERTKPDKYNTSVWGIVENGRFRVLEGKRDFFLGMHEHIFTHGNLSARWIFTKENIVTLAAILTLFPMLVIGLLMTLTTLNRWFLGAVMNIRALISKDDADPDALQPEVFSDSPEYRRVQQVLGPSGYIVGVARYLTETAAGEGTIEAHRDFWTAVQRFQLNQLLSGMRNGARPIVAGRNVLDIFEINAYFRYARANNVDPMDLLVQGTRLGDVIENRLFEQNTEDVVGAVANAVLQHNYDQRRAENRGRVIGLPVREDYPVPTSGSYLKTLRALALIFTTSLERPVTPSEQQASRFFVLTMLETLAMSLGLTALFMNWAVPQLILTKMDIAEFTSLGVIPFVLFTALLGWAVNSFNYASLSQLVRREARIENVRGWSQVQEAYTLLEGSNPHMQNFFRTAYNRFLQNLRQPQDQPGRGPIVSQAQGQSYQAGNFTRRPASSFAEEEIVGFFNKMLAVYHQVNDDPQQLETIINQMRANDGNYDLRILHSAYGEKFWVLFDELNNHFNKLLTVNAVEWDLFVEDQLRGNEVPSELLARNVIRQGSPGEYAADRIAQMTGRSVDEVRTSIEIFCNWYLENVGKTLLSSIGAFRSTYELWGELAGENPEVFANGRFKILLGYGDFGNADRVAEINRFNQLFGDLVGVHHMTDFNQRDAVLGDNPWRNVPQDALIYREEHALGGHISKVGSWSNKLPYLNTPVAYTLDSGHRSTFAGTMLTPFILHQFVRNPRLGMVSPVFRSYQEDWTGTSRAFSRGHRVWDGRIRSVDDYVGTENDYGKKFLRVGAFTSSGAFLPHLNSEDTAGGNMMIGEGWEIRHTEQVDVIQSVEKDHFLGRSFVERFGATVPELEQSRSWWEFLSNPSVHWTVKFAVLKNFAHYKRMPIMLGSLIAAIVLMMFFPFSGYVLLPCGLALLMLSFNANQSTNAMTLEDYREKEGSFKGVVAYYKDFWPNFLVWVAYEGGNVLQYIKGYLGINDFTKSSRISDLDWHGFGELYNSPTVNFTVKAASALLTVLLISPYHPLSFVANVMLPFVAAAFIAAPFIFNPRTPFSENPVKNLLQTFVDVGVYPVVAYIRSMAEMLFVDLPFLVNKVVLSAVALPFKALRILTGRAELNRTFQVEYTSFYARRHLNEFREIYGLKQARVRATLVQNDEEAARLTTLIDTRAHALRDRIASEARGNIGFRMAMTLSGALSNAAVLGSAWALGKLTLTALGVAATGTALFTTPVLIGIGAVSAVMSLIGFVRSGIPSFMTEEFAGNLGRGETVASRLFAWTQAIAEREFIQGRSLTIEVDAETLPPAASEQPASSSAAPADAALMAKDRDVAPVPQQELAAAKQEAPGGIDLAKTRVGVEASKEGGIQLSFDDPSMLRLLLNSQGLTPIIYDINIMTPSMINKFVGVNNI